MNAPTFNTITGPDWEDALKRSRKRSALRSARVLSAAAAYILSREYCHEIPARSPFSHASSTHTSIARHALPRS
jgi:hypothetical protein